MTAFFTIIIPTRNRPELIIDCIESVRRQDFQDLEILVSDNSSNDETEQLLDQSGVLRSIRYIRPEQNLSMPDHWEFASRHALGKYVLYLTDRSILKQGSLQKIYAAIKDHRRDEDKAIEIVSWKWDLYDDDLKMLMPAKTSTEHGHPSEIKTQTMLTDFLNTRGFFSYSFPRALNACYERNYGESIRQKFGRIFRSLAPDDSFAFTALCNLETILFINESLFISRGLKVSNGGKYVLGDPAGYFDTLGEDGLFRLCPMQSRTLENGHYEDYFRCLVAAGRPVTLTTAQWVEYYSKCYWEIYMRKTCAPREAQTVVRQYEMDWINSFARESKEIQAATREKIKKHWYIKVRIYLQSKMFLKLVLKYVRYVNAVVSGNVYKNALAAARFKES